MGVLNAAFLLKGEGWAGFTWVTPVTVCRFSVQ